MRSVLWARELSALTVAIGHTRVSVHVYKAVPEHQGCAGARLHMRLRAGKLCLLRKHVARDCAHACAWSTCVSACVRGPVRMIRNMCGCERERVV